MGTPVKGKDKLVYIGDGVGGFDEVEYQGDCTFSTGKTAEISRTKNGSHPYSNDGGASVVFSIEKERPALAVHTRIRDFGISEDHIAFRYSDERTGGERVSGVCKITVGDETTNVEGVLVQQVTLSVVDDPTYETV